MSEASTSSGPSLAAVPADLRAIHNSFLRYGREILDFQVPRLQQCTVAALLADYEAEINSSVEGLRRQVNELAFAIDEAETDAERTQVSQLVKEDRQQLESIRQSVRKALLAARRSIENARTQEARAGLRLAADNAKERTGGRRGGSSGEDKLMTTSQDVTDALRRTVTLMSSELEKSAMSSQLLEESTQTISSLSFQYGSLTTLMTNSAHMIKTMEREDLIGKGMVAVSFLFFLGCVAYILYVRVLSRGISIVAFFFRLFGLNRILGGAGSRSAADVQEKVELAQQAAKTLATSSLAASLTAAASAALSSATVAAGQATAKVAENIHDLNGDLESLTQTLLPEETLASHADRHVEL
ncbi:Sec20-domain-containing protein [Testicularia cyperi]|uniref:Sec20-domain-containing protein n=1 Tax=Testicularia cyperi TaxID=1882483 RepID=A0A317XPW2_9BASI|nr:Sec20-domain-containing protein [Testicularia cyperi]